jgi:LmbE family N-acetylglucosaminyl deacetylase
VSCRERTFFSLARHGILGLLTKRQVNKVAKLLRCWVLLLCAAMFLVVCATSSSQGLPAVRVIAFGAHPDDCDIRAAGLAAKYAAQGYKVKFVSVTNGDAGHQSEGGGMLATRRRAEAREAGRRIGIEYDVLDNHDGELLPTISVREQIIRKIREWKADIVLSPRPNDYHPDHRYTGMLVQDAAYMVTVPNIVPDTPALRKNPVFLYFYDPFTRPQPFRADIVVATDDVYSKKIDMLDAHVSQVYEWLPWHDGVLDQVPKDPAARKRWLAEQTPERVFPEWFPVLEKRYGTAASQIKHAEAFEITEYGRQPSEEEVRKLFPFFPEK